MNARGYPGLCAFCLCACFATHDGDDRVTLRGSRSDEASEPSAPAGRAADAGANGEPSRSTGERADAGSIVEPVGEGLQVWVGAVHVRGGNGLGCGPYRPERKQERALLLLQFGADGRLDGASLTLGEGPSLPKVEDPDAYYPPDPPWDWHGCPMEGLVPGFEYPVYDARLIDERLIASIHPADVDKEWCELQPSYPASPLAAAEWGDYLCRPTDDIHDLTDLDQAIPDPSRNTPLPPPFVVEELCFNVEAPCVCDADSCTASPYNAYHLDVQLTGDRISGSFGFMDIELERQE